MEQENGKETNRRSFMNWCASGAVALLAGAGSVIVGGFLYPIPRRKPRPQFICLESDIPEGGPMEIKDPAGRSVLLMRSAAGDLVAIGTVCSHLGCAVYYRPKKNLFECPCHQGVFDAEGNPIAGPPRAPLARYAVKISNRKVFVQFG